MDYPIWHYDGLSALRHETALVVEGERFRLTGQEGDHALADLEARDAVGGDAVYGLKRRVGWRIGFAGGVPQEIAALLPRHARYGRVIDRIGLVPAVGIFTVLAAVVVFVVLNTPSILARMIPPSVERKLGDLMVGDLGGRSCNGGNGSAALAALLQRIDANDAVIDVHVVNLPIVNAVTLPGGRVVVFDGLIRAAKSPEEVAGVLGHEIGHVRNRDVMESLLRQLGLSVVLGGLDGNVGGYTNALLASSYSRAAETRADGVAIDMLARAAVSPLPTAGFFTRLGRDAGDDSRIGRALTYLSSHPISRDRAALFTASAKGRKDFRPVLTADQWLALRQICLKDKDVEKPEFRF